MNRQRDGLERWERIALRRYFKDDTVVARLTALLEVERLSRRLGLRAGPPQNDRTRPYPPGRALRALGERTPSLAIEHRLVALFAE